MKIWLTLYCCLLLTLCSSAQLSKGQWLLGGALSFSSFSEKYMGVSASYTVYDGSAHAGYFFADKWAAGVRLGYTKNPYFASYAPHYYTIAPYLRYYFLSKEQKVNLFADGAYGYTKNFFSSLYNASGFMIKAGPSLFLTSSVALEFTIGFNHYQPIGQSYRVNEWHTGLGLQFHLPERPGK